MEKINIAEILKDCPKGMELDCTKFTDIYFDGIINKAPIFKIKLKIKTYGTWCSEITLDEYGRESNHPNAKCIIFPKGKTTWEGFQRPFKDGDIIVCEDDGKINQMFILKSQINNNRGYCYIGYDFDFNKFFNTGDWHFDRLATEEEKQKLFDVIKANGYKWDDETKTLKKMIVPKFKVGDRVKKNKDYISGIVTDIFDDSFKVTYDSGGCSYVQFHYQCDWELVPNKFDITTLKPFESRVLVRSSMDGLWKPAVFGFRNGYNDNAFYIVGGSCWKQCIPYLNNEHLCGTTNDCDDYYKTWQ